MKFFGQPLSSLFPRRRTLPKGEAGVRAYAVGDVHGRLDLLNNLLTRIEGDIDPAQARTNFLVFLGDLIDRGPESAGVLERLRTYSFPRITPVFLMGNHEEVFLSVLKGERKLLRRWLKFGGGACLESYGIDPEPLWTMHENKALELIASRVPATHQQFLQAMKDIFPCGDYLFVHAGIRPGIEIAQQSKSDLRWIREPFLTSRKTHEFIIVHGHTIRPEVDERPNRIGIDTGAYLSGRLTAIVIEDEGRRYLTIEGPAGNSFSRS